jgi:acetyltransferase
MVRFSRLVSEQHFIKEIDINPLLASHEGLLALDGRVVLHDLDVPEADLPRSAIRPYPVQYASFWTTNGGEELAIRPIRPEDEPHVVEFHHELSENTVYLRYFQMMKLSQRIAHERMTRICFIDYNREMALVAEGDSDKGDGSRAIRGVARLSKKYGTDEAEFAVLVTDRSQRKGLGTEMLRRLLEVARVEHIRVVTADMLTVNEGMHRLCQKLGFTITKTEDPNVLRATIILDPTAQA